MARTIKKGKRSRFQPPRGLTPLTGATENFEELARSFAARDDSPIEPLNSAQARYIATIQDSILTFGLGPAGTGKTFLATALACQALLDREVDKIIVTRPAVEAGEELGFLPGDLSEKFSPYFAPVRQVMEKRLGRGAAEMLLKNGKIEILPLALMRGHSFWNAFVLLDEAQNTSPVQMKLFLTRLGENCKVVINGDESQMDIPGPCGLTDGLHRVGNLDDVGVVRFTKADVVRSGLVQAIVESYENK